MKRTSEGHIDARGWKKPIKVLVAIWAVTKLGAIPIPAEDNRPGRKPREVLAPPPKDDDWYSRRAS